MCYNKHVNSNRRKTVYTEKLKGGKGFQTMKTKRQNITKKTAVNTATQPTATAEIITADNVQTIGKRIATAALRAYFAPEIVDVKMGSPLSDDYDIARIAIVFLYEYIGETLQDKTTDGQTDKDGKPITILRACIRAVNRYIIGEIQYVYATAYKTATAKIAEMKLSTNEKRILIYRLCGVSLKGIAHIIGADGRNVTTYLQRIRTKAQKIGLTANA